MRSLGRTPLFAAAALLAAVGISGCAPFLNETLRRMDQSQRAKLPDSTPLDSVELEVFLIERPFGDPLAGDVLWNHLDRISSVDAATRERLQANGLRFGIAGSSMPYALSGLTTAPRDAGPGERTSQQVYAAPSGVVHEFTFGPLPSPVIIRQATESGVKEGQYLQAQGLFRCRVERTQSGWVELEVTPEIHHGQHQRRPEANDTAWDWTGRQEVETLYRQRFRIGLNQGESLVLGAVGEQVDSVGARFLRTNENGSQSEKLIVIRVKSIGRVHAVSQAGQSSR